MRAWRSIVVVALLTLTWCVSEANAQFSELQQLLYRGTEYIGNRNFSLSPEGGPLFNNNIFDHAVRFDRVGQGYSYEEFRFFGPDTWDNPNTVDLGPFKLQLGRDPTILGTPNPVGVHNRVGYTTRFIPEVFFESETGQRAFDVFSGQTNFTNVPIAYTATFDAGVQQFEWTGNILLDTRGKINAMGFYDFDMRIMNVGDYTADGYLVHDEQVTDFDTGQVKLSGNMLFDLFGSLAQGFGQFDAAIPPRTISAAASSKQKVDSLMAQLRNGEEISQEDMQFLVSQMFMTAFQNDPIGFLTNGMPAEVAGFEDLEFSVNEEQPDAEAAAAAAAAVPEPGMLMLLVVLAGVWAACYPTARQRFAL